jgi:hypothetical protein
MVLLGNPKPNIGIRQSSYLVESMVTLEGFLPFNFKHDTLSYLAIQKNYTYIAKQCSHVEFPYFVMGLHFGPPWHRSH